MKPTRLLLISAFLTAAILVVIGGVTSQVLASRSTSDTGGDQAAIEEYQAREAEYNQLITQANQQIEKANADLKAMETRLNEAGLEAAAPAPSGAAEPAFAAAVSTEEAARIASEAAEKGQKAQRGPELVSFEGKAAYEIPFEKGSIYVSAETGEVLFNGTVPQELTADQAAQIASDYLGKTGVLQVDRIPFHGKEIYRVIFNDGWFAFMNLDGQITNVQAPSPSITAQLVDDSGGGSGGGGGGYHDDDHHDDHEDHEEHDD